MSSNLLVEFNKGRVDWLVPIMLVLLIVNSLIQLFNLILIIFDGIDFLANAR